MKFLIIGSLPSDRKQLIDMLGEGFGPSELTELNQLELFEKDSPLFQVDVVLVCASLDHPINLPVFTQMRTHFPYLPMVMIGDSVPIETVVEALKSGFNDYLTVEHLARLPVALNTCLKKIQIQKEHDESIQQVRVLEERYRMICELTSDYSFSIRLDQQENQIREWVTPNFSRVTGYAAEEFEQLGGWRQIIHPDDLPVALQRFQSLLLGQPDISELRILTKSGDIRWVRAFGHPVRDVHEPDVFHVYGAVQDITAQKLAEEALRKTNALLKAQQEAVGSGILLIDNQRRILSYNQRFIEIWEIPEAVIQLNDSKRLLQFVKDSVEDSGEFIQTVEYLYSHPDEVREDEIIKLKSGRVLSRNTRPVRLSDGIIVGRAWNFADITERKWAEQALRQSEERYRQFFEEDVAGAYISSPNGMLLACNPAFARIFGYDSVEEALKKNTASLYPTSEARARFLSLLQEKKKLEHHETELRHRDGNIIYVLENAIGTFDEAGKLVEIKGYLFDITQRKILESHLHQSQKMEAVGRLAGGIAHDFNNLLTAISGYNALLLKHLDPTTSSHQMAEEVKKAVDRATLLTRQLLTFSHSQLHQPQILDLNSVITEISNMLERLISEDIHLSIHLDPALKPVKADPSQIEQVVVNLVINARDAMPNGGELSISTTNTYLTHALVSQYGKIQPGPYVTFVVRDTGCGMDIRTQSHIFEPFFTTKERGKGTGLGLATVYGIITQSGGNIEVASTLGQGTSFTIYLPQVEKTASSSSTTASASCQGEFIHLPCVAETILLAEDDEIVRGMLQDVLEMSGYRVLVAGHGLEALQITQQYLGPIHLMVTDMVMPHMSGLELAERLVCLLPNLKVLFISGYTEKNYIHQDALKSNQCFLGKPFTPEEFIDKVRDMLGTSEEEKLSSIF